MEKDFSALTTIIADLTKLQVDRDEAIKHMASMLAQMFLNKVKKRTPVGVKPDVDEEAMKYWEGYQGGTLRRKWRIKSVQKKGDTWTATIFNSAEYASYVENGHRQERGRYVPQLGKSLKKAWVDGQFMMKLSAEEVEKEGPAYIRREFEAFLRRHWGGK